MIKERQTSANFSQLTHKPVGSSIKMRALLIGKTVSSCYKLSEKAEIGKTFWCVCE